MGLLSGVTELSENDKQIGHRRVIAQPSNSILPWRVYTSINTYLVGLKSLSFSQMEASPPSLVEAMCGADNLAAGMAAYVAVQAVPQGEASFKK